MKTEKKEKKIKTLPKELRNPILKLMRKGKPYQLMELTKNLKVTRQYVNFMLNQGLKDKTLIREGTRRYYLYTRI